MHTEQIDAADDVARAEQAALARQADEDQAEQRFREARARLTAQGLAEEVTTCPEFRDWMDKRHRTDEAWGRWAMAKDAELG